jgi:hypothetical protein
MKDFELKKDVEKSKMMMKNKTKKTSLYPNEKMNYLQRNNIFLK